VKVKTAELEGPALDWAVAKAKKMPLVSRGRKWTTDGAATVEYAPWAVHPVVDGSGPYVAALCHHTYSPSTDWAHGGPIIEREGIRLHRSVTGQWWAGPESDPFRPVAGATPLIAAMRCFVTSRLGDEIEVPDELRAYSNREADASQDQADVLRPRSRA
jgi:hypothetical protein